MTREQRKIELAQEVFTIGNNTAKYYNQLFANADIPAILEFDGDRYILTDISSGTKISETKTAHNVDVYISLFYNVTI